MKNGVMLVLSFIATVFLASMVVITGIDTFICGSDCLVHVNELKYIYSGLGGLFVSAVLLVFSVVVFRVYWKRLNKPKIEDFYEEKDMAQKRFEHRYKSGLRGTDLTEGLYD